jgi:hypothetical protein
LRVDFHERFRPEDFYSIVPELERLKLDWIEEPFTVGTELRRPAAAHPLAHLGRRALLGPRRAFRKSPSTVGATSSCPT